MFDMSWGEFLLLGGVAVVVLKPKDIPEAMRTFGRGVNKLRRMAGEFQGQFNQALREANLEDVKKEFDNIRQVTSGIGNPASLVTNQIKNSILAPVGSTAAAAVPAALPDPAAEGTSVIPRSPPIEEELREDIPSAFALSPKFRRT